MLKSGCSIDDLAHETAERLRRAIAINLVIGWRIMLMTLLGREPPELPAEILFSDIEIRTLHAYAKKKGLKPPTQLGDAVLLVAAIGGYLGRKKDPPPGHQLLWFGVNTHQLPDGLTGLLAFQIPHGAVDRVARATCWKQLLQFFPGNSFADLIGNIMYLFKYALSILVKVEDPPVPHLDRDIRPRSVERRCPGS